MHEWQLLLQFMGKPKVVAVQECEVAASGMGQGMVPGGSRSLVLGLQEDSDSCVIPGRLLQYLRRIVGGSVVGDEQFPVLEALLQDALDGLPYEPGRVVGRHDNGNEWFADLCHCLFFCQSEGGFGG